MWAAAWARPPPRARVPAGLRPVPGGRGQRAPARRFSARLACPDKPGAPSPDPKRNGCPGLVEVKAGQIVIKQQVFFKTGKDEILKKSFKLLDSVAHSLTAISSIKKVEVEGHSDNKGKDDKNIDLSARRARSVLRYLIERGVAAERLVSKGYGPSRPIADNKTAKGRALNRRVDFRITDPAQADAPKTP